MDLLTLTTKPMETWTEADCDGLEDWLGDHLAKHPPLTPVDVMVTLGLRAMIQMRRERIESDRRFGRPHHADWEGIERDLAKTQPRP